MLSFFRIVSHPLKFRLFLLKKLPAAYFAGLRIVVANEERCEVTVPFKWFTQNPFRSTYFACLSMAAEMSTGVLAMANVYHRKPSVSMLVVGNEAQFFKKATGTTRFVCEEGQKIAAAINGAVATGEGQTVKALSTGYNENGEVVARFVFQWSFKAKNTVA